MTKEGIGCKGESTIIELNAHNIKLPSKHLHLSLHNSVTLSQSLTDKLCFAGTALIQRLRTGQNTEKKWLWSPWPYVRHLYHTYLQALGNSVEGPEKTVLEQSVKENLLDMRQLRDSWTYRSCTHLYISSMLGTQRQTDSSWKKKGIRRLCSSLKGSYGGWRQGCHFLQFYH